jgi:hypothetical protein
MKKLIIIIFLSFGVGTITLAQVTKKKSVSGTKTQSKNTTRLSSTGNYPAKSNIKISLADHYTTSDPVRTFNTGPVSFVPNISSPATFGLPKSAYGFANGHFSLFSTGSTSSGGNTGNGLVGTGSSPGSFGGGALGLNGKSPYAGFAMWGNARGLWITRGDSAVRRPSGKRN